MIVARYRPDTSFDGVRFDCPKCTVNLMLMNAKNAEKKFKCPYCGDNFLLKVTVQIAVESVAKVEHKGPAINIQDFANYMQYAATATNDVANAMNATTLTLADLTDLDA